MNFWNQVPMLRLIIPFLIGITIALGTDGSFIFSDYFFISLLIIFIAWVYYYKKIIKNYSRRWLLGLFIYIIIILGGYQLTVLNISLNDADHFSHYHLKNAEVVADITEPPVEKESTIRLVVDVRNIKDSVTWKEVSGKAIIYIEKDSMSSALHYGDRLMLSSDFCEVRPPQNPSEINYKKYLANRSVYHQAYAKSGMWKLLSRDHGNIFMTVAINIRNVFLGIFKDNHIGGSEFAVASALIVGYTDKIDPELLRDYANVGVMHVLCVAGLHVGIVFLLLNYFLFFLEKFKHGKIIKAVVLLLLMWLYAMITGLSPSVLRVAVMFTFVTFGRSYNRQMNVFNSLAASAFFLLLIDPFILTAVGFQLSYLAVTGILIIQPFLSSLWHPGNKIMKELWGITTVSVAAQIATYPLCVLDFHQFPNYFLPSNIIVVPLANLIIYSGMLTLFTAPVGWLSMLFAKLMSFSVIVMNSSVKFIEGLPYSIIQGITISNFEMILLYVISFFVIFFFIKRNFRWLKYAFFCIIAMELIACFYKIRETNQEKFIVYNINKTSALDFVDGMENLFLADASMIHDQSRIAFHIQNNWWNLGLKHSAACDIADSSITQNNAFSTEYFRKDNFIQYGNKRIAMINKANANLISSEKIRVDYLILTENAKVSISDMVKQYNARLIIFDSSNSRWYVEKWKKECQSQKCSFYSVIDQGAFITDLKY